MGRWGWIRLESCTAGKCREGYQLHVKILGAGWLFRFYRHLASFRHLRMGISEVRKILSTHSAKGKIDLRVPLYSGLSLWTRYALTKKSTIQSFCDLYLNADLLLICHLDFKLSYTAPSPVIKTKKVICNKSYEERHRDGNLSQPWCEYGNFFNTLFEEYVRTDRYDEEFEDDATAEEIFVCDLLDDVATNDEKKWKLFRSGRINLERIVLSKLSGFDGERILIFLEKWMKRISYKARHVLLLEI